MNGYVRCFACDRPLTTREAKRKSKTTGEELGLCDFCLGIVEEIQPIQLADDSFSDEALELDQLMADELPDALRYLVEDNEE